MGGGVTTAQAYTLADILGVDLHLDAQKGTLTGSGSFKATLGDLVVEFPLEIAGGAGSSSGCYAVARSRGNLLIIAGRNTKAARSTSLCALVDVAQRPEWRDWLASTKTRTYDAALRELGKAVVARFAREPGATWKPAV